MTKNFLLLPVVLMIINACNQPAEGPDQVLPKDRMDSISYIIGYDYGKGIREQEIKANPFLVYKGIYDALNKEQGLFDDSLQSRLIAEFNQELEVKDAERFNEMLAKNKQDGEKFLEENSKKADVFVLPSGLQYKVMKLGSGDYPSVADSITIHYRAMYLDRTTFDMSYDGGPVDIRINHLVKGLTEGIRLMQPGAIFEFYIPSQLAYGDRNYLDLVPAGSTVIYTIELIAIHNKK
ncbi:MAG: FKBP-type peptidyl-prolyl cis-trans isomerase [Bacteroidales bacterium]|nr:FKBP-type peptidyl-prolyl cis-trans isomerase [Bacteroidales bacterium]